MTHYLCITPRDPLIARDGRPFGMGQGQRMRSLAWPYPSVSAGSLRTLLGKQADPDFSPDTVEALKALSIAGPLPMVDGSLFFPWPHDCLLREEKKRACFAVRPVAIEENAGEGCDLPGGLRPVMLSHDAGDFKPAKRQPAFWSRDRIVEWLLNASGSSFSPPPAEDAKDKNFIDAPPQDVRFHIRMDPQTGAGKKEDAFFLTAGLDFSRKRHVKPICMSARVTANNGFSDILQDLDALHPIGGERRLAHWQNIGTDHPWKCPDSIRKALAGSDKVRMVLATPAIFSGDWKPGWLGSGTYGLEGKPPGSNVRLSLVGVSITRWLPLSGWSLEKDEKRVLKPGPKPVRRLVPAGGTYFFEVAGGNPEKLADYWLQSVCDDKQDQRDGFGLALWGIWDEHGSAEKGA